MLAFAVWWLLAAILVLSFWNVMKHLHREGKRND